MSNLTVKVDRKRWLCGEEEGFLYRKGDRKMCCLGFVARKVGGRVSEIVGEETPEECPHLAWPKGLRTGLGFPSGVCRDLMDTNDGSDLDNETREREIKKLGKEVGIDFVFVGSYE